MSFGFGPDVDDFGQRVQILVWAPGVVVCRPNATVVSVLVPGGWKE